MRIYTKEEEKMAKQLAKMMVNSSREIGDDILAHLDVGSSISEHDLSHLNVEREKEVEGFRGWKVFYIPQMDPERFTPGYFGVKYVDDSGRTLLLLELREENSDIIPTIFKSGTEWNKFPSREIEATKKMFKDFKHEFDVLFSVETLPNAIEVAIERDKRLIRAQRTAHRVFFETGMKLGKIGTLVPKEEVAVIKETLGVGA